MRIAFFGTPEFSVPTLEALDGAGHAVVLVVTRPDARRGRGRKLAPPAVKAAALRAGLSVFQPHRANQLAAVERLRSAAPELGVVVAYGGLLSGEVLSVPTHGFLNVHASLLPKYRGAAPINWAVMCGEKESGVTIIRMVPELDAGPILAQRSVPIGDDETAGELHDRLCGLGSELLLDVVSRISSGERPPERRQDASAASYAPRLTKKDARTDWNRPAGQIRNRVRGLTPWPGAVCRFLARGGAQDVILLRVAEGVEVRAARDVGEILRADEHEGIVVQAGQGEVIIQMLKPASGRAMTAADFIHGRRVRAGDRFA